MKIGFLLLRNIHHIYHIAPIAYELSRREDTEVTIFTAFTRSIHLLNKFNPIFPDHKCKIKILQQSLIREIMTPSFKRRPFPRAKNIIRNNVHQLLSLDGIVSPDFYTDFLIKELDRKQIESRPKFIFTFHGAGDRAFGFRNELNLYDFLLISGEKVKERLQRCNILDEKNWKIIGYPKFDIIKQDNCEPNCLFNNSNPIVLYNPHFQKNLSSWPSWGLNILEEFLKNDNYNLIFAPHITLFEKKQQHREIPRKYFEASNIYIDTSSEQCVNMRYTNTADIYLGDASSQVYEFINRPRPCIFLNAHHADWVNNSNYLHWTLGHVVNNFSELMPAIGFANEHHKKKIEIQKLLFNKTFDTSDNVTASKRGADAIITFLESSKKTRPELTQKKLTDDQQFIDFCRNVEKTIENIDGYITQREVHFLAMLAAYPTAKGAILEIGSFKGKSTIVLAIGSSISDKTTIYAVDPLTAPSITDPDLTGQESSETDFFNNLKEANVENLVKFNKMYSCDYAPSWKDPIRLLWIDGDHTYKGTKLDFDLFAPYLADGAIVAIDDVLNRFEGGIRVFMEDILLSHNFGPCGMCGSIGWSQYFKDPKAGRRYKTQKTKLYSKLAKLVPYVFCNEDPKHDNETTSSKNKFKFFRALIPHSKTLPSEWLKKVRQ